MERYDVAADLTYYHTDGCMVAVRRWAPEGDESWCVDPSESISAVLRINVMPMLPAIAENLCANGCGTTVNWGKCYCSNCVADLEYERRRRVANNTQGQ